jgi:hypothetical protein
MADGLRLEKPSPQRWYVNNEWIRFVREVQQSMVGNFWRKREDIPALVASRNF